MASVTAGLMRLFQSALPLRGVTVAAARDLRHLVISIRTPLAGSDERVPCLGQP